MVPPGVHSVRVLVVGGGAGGSNGEGCGGSSGYVEVREVAVSPLDVISVTVGRGGAGGANIFQHNGDINIMSAPGQPSMFGALVLANGGQGSGHGKCGSGGSGGGGGVNYCSERSCVGGTDGANGNSAEKSQNISLGQGPFSPLLRSLRLSAFSAGSGGSGSSLVRCGGGGGGGVLMNGNGPTGGNGGCAFGGHGFGGGGAGGFLELFLESHIDAIFLGAGGNGADGLVYVEWSI